MEPSVMVMIPQKPVSLSLSPPKDAPEAGTAQTSEGHEALGLLLAFYASQWNL